MPKNESLPFSVVEFKRSGDKTTLNSCGEAIVHLQQQIEERNKKISELKEEMEKVAKRNNLPPAFFTDVWRYNQVTSTRSTISKIKLLEAGIKKSVIEKCTDVSVSKYIRVSSANKKGNGEE